MGCHGATAFSKGSFTPGYDDVLILAGFACITERGFYLCPMTGRLRVAGTVELGGLKAPPSPHRPARVEALIAFLRGVLTRSQN